MEVCPVCRMEMDDTETVCPKCGHNRSSAAAMVTTPDGLTASPRVPGLVRVAGTVWIVIGRLGLLTLPLVLLVLTDVGGWVGSAMQAILIYGVFLHVGVQSVQGTARDTLGNGIGSILFGLVNLGVGVVVIVSLGEMGWGIAGGLLFGLVLLAAGVLALVSRQDYKAWRQAQSQPRRPACRSFSMTSFLKILLGLFFVASGYGGIATNLHALLDPAIGSQHLAICLLGMFFCSVFLLGGSWLVVSELRRLRKRWADIKGSWNTYIVLAGCLLGGLVWLLLQLEVLPSSRTIPPGLTVQAVEAAYPKLFKRVYEQAKIGGTAAATEEEAFDKSLPPEVIGIEIGRYPGYCCLGMRTFSKYQARSFFPRLPKVGTPVLNQYWYSGEDGSKKTVIVYEALVPLPLGSPREIIVCFDLKGLQERLHAQ